MLLFSFLSQQQKNRQHTRTWPVHYQHTRTAVKSPETKTKKKKIEGKKNSWSIVKIRKKEEKMH